MTGTSVGASLVAARLVQSWTAKMNVASEKVKVLAVVFVLVTAALSVVLTVLTAGNREIIPTGPVFLGLTLTLLHFLTVLSSISVTAASAQDSSVMAWWRATPVSDRTMGLGWSIPMWCLALAQMAITLPTLIVLFGDTSGTGLVAFTGFTAVVTGTVFGRAIFVAAREILRRLSVNLAAHAQALATLAWVLAIAGAMHITRLIVGPDTAAAPALVSMLGYPSLVLAAADPSVVHLGIVSAWLVVALLVETALWPYIAAVRHDPSKILRVGPEYNGPARFPLLRLEVTRLIRRRRVQAATLSTLVIQAGLITLHPNIDAAARSSFLDNSILVNSILVCYAPLLARGMSQRSLPYARAMGQRPGPWALAVSGSGIFLALMTAIPALVVWSARSGDSGVFIAGLGLASFTSAAAAVIGFLLTPSEDTGAVETICLLMVGASVFVVAKALTQLGFDTLLTSGPVMAVLALGLLFIPSLIEVLRWSSQPLDVTLGKDSS